MSWYIALMVVKSDGLKLMVVARLEVAEGKVTSLLGVANPADVALGPRGKMGVVAAARVMVPAHMLMVAWVSGTGG